MYFLIKNTVEVESELAYCFELYEVYQCNYIIKVIFRFVIRYKHDVKN